MRAPKSPSAGTGSGTLDAIDVPVTPAVLPRLLPAVAAALDGGPALLPVPEGPPPVRDAVLAAARPEAALESPDTAFVVPTSGSTGDPKAVLLSAAAVGASADATHARLGGSGRWLLALPATHIAGLMVLARSVVAGTTPVALDLTHGFDPELFAAASMRLFASRGARRYTAMVPRQLGALLEAGGAGLHAATGYDAVLVGGSAIRSALLDRARDAGVNVVLTYGMTETSGGCVYDGVPLDGVHVEVRDDRRILLSGPTLATGYRLAPDLTTQAFDEGRFVTADVGRLDADHRLIVDGRVDDVAVSGGVNVPLVAVDDAVASHPAIAEALAVGVPDDLWGQRIVALVVPRDRANPPSLDSVRAHVTRQVPAAFAPKEILVVDALPLGPGGKVDRRGTAARLAEVIP
jgi:O-succinylbenzoic acid--CoA ligase